MQWPFPTVRPYLTATVAGACVIAMAIVLIRLEQRTSPVTQEAQALRDHVSYLQHENISLKEKISGETQHQVGAEANNFANADGLRNCENNERMRQPESLFLKQHDRRHRKS